MIVSNVGSCQVTSTEVKANNLLTITGRAYVVAEFAQVAPRVFKALARYYGGFGSIAFLALELASTSVARLRGRNELSAEGKSSLMGTSADALVQK